MPIFPAIADAVKQIRDGFGSEIISLRELKDVSSFGIDGSGYEAEMYRRDGFYGIANALSGYTSHSGINVTGDRALEITGLYSGIKIISQDIGSLPFLT